MEINTIDIDNKKEITIKNIDSITIKSRPVIAGGHKEDDGLFSIKIGNPEDIEICKNSINLNNIREARSADYIESYNIANGNPCMIFKSGTRIEMLGIFSYVLQSEATITETKYYVGGELFKTNQIIEQESKKLNIEEEGTLIINILNDAECSISYKETEGYQKTKYPDGITKVKTGNYKTKEAGRLISEYFKKCDNVIDLEEIE